MRTTTRTPRWRVLPKSLADVADLCGERFPSSTLWLDRPPDLDPTRGTALTQEQVAQLIAEASGWLSAMGVGRWDRVAVVKRNHADIQMLAHAAWRIGAVPALINSGMQPHEGEEVLARLRPALVVTDVTTLTSGALSGPRVRALAPRIFVVDGEVDGLPSLDSVRGAPPAPPTPLRMEEPALVTHTSGTTGTPKLVLHKGRCILQVAGLEPKGARLLGLGEGQDFGVCVSYVHAAATAAALSAMALGVNLASLSTPDPATARAMFEAHPPLGVEALPNIFLLWEQMAEETGVFAGTKYFFNRYDAIHPRTVRTLLASSRRRLPAHVQGYGQTETAGIAIRVYFRRTLAKPRGTTDLRDMGFRLPDPRLRLRVVDADGNRVPSGVVGQLEYAGSTRCLSYVGEDDRHRANCHGRWWNTGDLGFVRRGRVHLLDRQVDQIVGVDSCLAIEDVLLDRLDELTEVVIVSSPEGEATAVVATRGDVPIDADRWAETTRDLPPLRGPVHLSWDDIPRTGTWKVRRFLLARHLAERAAEHSTA